MIVVAPVTNETELKGHWVGIEELLEGGHAVLGPDIKLYLKSVGKEGPADECPLPVTGVRLAMEGDDRTSRGEGFPYDPGG